MFGYKFKGRAHVDPDDPQAYGICDVCSFQYNLRNLHFSKEWAGQRLVDQKLMVCERCDDKPNPQLRSLSLPADPTPIKEPRPDSPEYQFTNFLTTETGDVITDEGGQRFTIDNA